MNSHNPEIGVKTRIIKRSQAFGIPPLVVRPDLPAKKKQQLREILLGMHQDPAGKQILAAMNIKRFVLGDDSAYDSIRQMRQFIKQQDEGH
jgi:phosphonate transport system substrate-binding protein